MAKKKDSTEQEPTQPTAENVLVECRNLESWSGMDFSYAPGQVVLLPAEVAVARAAEGLVELI